MALGATRIKSYQVRDDEFALQAELDEAVPVGMIMAWTDSTPPTGWLECDGAAVSRTTYADLFTAISTKYGVGDGSTTFNIPDTRGYALRGFDNGAGNDPDAASRTNRGDGTTGDNVGTKQNHAVQGHFHAAPQNPSASSFLGGNIGNATLFVTVSAGSVITESSTTGSPTTDGTNGTALISSESRMKNIGFMFIIRY